MPNKKSQLEDMLAFLLIAIILFFGFFYYFYSNFNKGERLQQQVEKKIIDRDSSDLVINYLRSPLDANNGLSVEEALNNYFVNSDSGILDQTRANAKTFFSKSYLETEDSTWSLVITYGSKELEIDSDRPKVIFVDKTEISKIFFPTTNTDKFMELRLFTKHKNTQNENIPT